MTQARINRFLGGGTLERCESEYIRPYAFFPQKLHTPVTNWAYCLIFMLLFVMGWAMICCIGDGLDFCFGFLNTDFSDYTDADAFLGNTHLANLTNVDEGGPPWCFRGIRLVRGKKYLGAAELFAF